jgi:hypothetical protein
VNLGFGHGDLLRARRRSIEGYGKIFVKSRQ